MCQNDEITAFQLHRLLTERGYNINIRTVLRCCASLGWMFHGSAFCQLIRAVNKEKRLLWARRHLSDNFLNVIWTDECTLQL